jgi:hypothetical protein
MYVTYIRQPAQDAYSSWLFFWGWEYWMIV